MSKTQLTKPNGSHGIPWTPVFVSFPFAAALLLEMSTFRYGASPLLPQVITDRQSFIAQILFLAVIGGLLLRIGRARESSSGFDHYASNSQTKFWAPYLLAWIFSAIASDFAQLSFQHLMSLTFIFALSLFLDWETNTEKLKQYILVFCRVFVAINAIFAILSPERTFAPYQIWPGGWFEGVDRYQGILPHPNSLAFCLSVILIIEVSAKNKFRFAWAIPIIVMILLSGSRTSSIALLAAFAIQFLLTNLTKFKAWLLTSAISITVLFSIMVENWNSLAGSLNGRSEFWDYAANLFTINPIFGVGAGIYQSSTLPFAGYAHNQILNTAVETGIIGVIALAFGTFLLVRSLIFRDKKSNAIALVSFWLLLGLSENVLRIATINFLPQILFFQLALFVVMSSAKVHSREKL